MANSPRLAAFSHRGFLTFWSLNSAVMMADNMEHVITYWTSFQKFHSALLGGFAVISHWVPYLFLSIPSGILADRLDPRRLIQIGMSMFLCCSLGCAYFIYTDTLTIPIAMGLLILHGLSGVLWSPSEQVLLFDIVGAQDVQSAVRLTSSGRYLGMLCGPAIGSVLILTLSPTGGLLVNAFIYIPYILWLWKAPFGPQYRQQKQTHIVRLQGFSEVITTLRYVFQSKNLLTMIALSRMAAFCVGTSYQAQMPQFATDLGNGQAGLTYAILLGADACGALVAGFSLELIGRLKTKPINAVRLCALWAIALLSFSLAHSYWQAVISLFFAGFFDLAFNSMSMAIVQMSAPQALRGKIIGVAVMSNLGLRMFSGINVGIMGQSFGVHQSLATSAFMALTGVTLLWWFGFKRTNEA